MLVKVKLFPLWLIFLLVLTDHLLDFLRQIGLSKGVKIYASSMAKAGTTLYYVLFPTFYFLQYIDSIYINIISLILLAIIMIYVVPTFFGYDNHYKKCMVSSWIFIFLYIIIRYDSLALFESIRKSFIFVTLFYYTGSNVQYFYNNWSIVKK